MLTVTTSILAAASAGRRPPLPPNAEGELVHNIASRIALLIVYISKLLVRFPKHLRIAARRCSSVTISPSCDEKPSVVLLSDI